MKLGWLPLSSQKLCDPDPPGEVQHVELQITTGPMLNYVPYWDAPGLMNFRVHRSQISYESSLKSSWSPWKFCPVLSHKTATRVPLESQTLPQYTSVLLFIIVINYLFLGLIINACIHNTYIYIHNCLYLLRKNDIMTDKLGVEHCRP